MGVGLWYQVRARSAAKYITTSSFGLRALSRLPSASIFPSAPASLGAHSLQCHFSSVTKVVLAKRRAASAFSGPVWLAQWT